MNIINIILQAESSLRSGGKFEAKQNVKKNKNCSVPRRLLISNNTVRTVGKESNCEEKSGDETSISAGT
jgi:hypothetical protein